MIKNYFLIIGTFALLTINTSCKDEKSGNKKSIGEYSNGQKTGKWFFWTDNNLSEVDYSDSRVAQVKNWKQDAVANRN